MIRFLLPIALIVVFGISSLSAGSYKLDTSEKIKGKLLVLNPENAKIQSDYGMIDIPFKTVAEMDFSGESFEYIFTLKDGSVVKGNLISFAQGVFAINTTAGIITINANSINECIETGYKNKVKQDKDTEEINRVQARVDHISLSAGYGLLLGTFTDKYNPGVYVQLGYDRPFFQGGLQNFRFGVLAGYENLPSKTMTGVSLDVITFAATVRYIFSFTSDSFWSKFLPFAQVGAGGCLLRLNYASGTNEAGLNPALVASVGLNFVINSWLDISIFSEYQGVLETGLSLNEIRFGGGAVIKL
jgi:hypothetical protein